MSIEEDEEYITYDNDPTSVEKITKEDYTYPEKEEKIEFDNILATPQCKITNLSNYDHMREEIVLDALRRGLLR